MASNTGRLFIVSGPSGSGKDTICSKLIEKYNTISVSPSYTTRAMTEKDNKPGGKYYEFISKEKFQEMIENGAFLEHSIYCDNYYGTPKKDVKQLLEEGKKVILILDIEGAFTIKGIIPESTLIFIMPPSIDELIKRLKSRERDSEEEMKKRLDQVEHEIEMGKKYDYILINNDIEDTVEKVAQIIFKKGEK